MSAKKKRFQIARNNIRSALLKAAQQDLDFQRDAESYVRYMATFYETAFTKEEWQAVPNGLSILTIAGPGGKKTVNRFEMKTWGANSDERQTAFYEGGRKFTGAEGLPLIIFTEGEAWAHAAVKVPQANKDEEALWQKTDERKEIVFISAATLDGRIIRGELQIKRGENNRLLPDGDFEFITNLVDDSDLIEMKDNLAITFFRGWIDRYAEEMENLPSHN